MRIANRVRDKELLVGHWLPSPCSFLLFFTSSLLWMHLTLPAVTHLLSTSSHTVYPPLHSGLTGTSRGHSPHTHATTSMHMACSQVPSRMLSHVDVLSVNTQREYSGAGSASCLAQRCLQCSRQLEDVDSVSPINGLLRVHPVFSHACFSVNLAAKVFPCWKPEDSIHVGHGESSSLLRSSRHSWL